MGTDSIGSTYSSVTSTTTDDSYSGKESTKDISSNLDLSINSSFSLIGRLQLHHLLNNQLLNTGIQELDKEEICAC